MQNNWMTTPGPNVSFVSREGDLYAIIIRKEFRREGVNFMTPNAYPMQVAVSSYEVGSSVKPHFHNNFERSINDTMEVVHIDEGEATVSFFDDKTQALIGTHTLRSGDTVIFVKGIHGLAFKEKTRLIEVKQGPYMGADIDKTCVDVKQ